METRLARVRALLSQEGIDALLVTQPENRRWLSGFTGSAGTLVVSGEKALLATDFRYFDQVRAQAKDFELRKMDGGMAKLLPTLVAETGAKRVGFEAAHMPYQAWSEWAAALPGVEMVPTKEILEPLRAIKDDGELTIIRKAVALTDRAYAHVRGWMKPGMTEAEVAWEIEKFLRENGAEGLAFDTIVAAGTNGAMAHHHPGSRKIREGEPIVMDFGAKVDGYCSDFTRTVLLGEPDARFREIYSLVLEAQLAAIAGIREGLSCKEADGLARSIIAAAGHADHFGHGLGHGFGLAIHEQPRVSHLSDGALAAGMMVTVEPGVYLPEWGGVRIEDVVLVTPTGCEVFTGSPKEIEPAVVG